MKKRFLTFLCAIALSVLASTGFAADRLFPNLEKREDLTSVYIGKGMLRLIGDGASNLNLGNLGNTDVEVAELLSYIDGIEVVNADSKKAANYFRPIAQSTIKSIPGIELAMEQEEDKDHVQIYVTPSADGAYFTRLIIVNSEEDEYTVIDLKGQIPLDKLSAFSN